MPEGTRQETRVQVWQTTAESVPTRARKRGKRWMRAIVTAQEEALRGFHEARERKKRPKEGKVNKREGKRVVLHIEGSRTATRDQMEGNSPLNNNFSFWVGKEATPSKTCGAKRGGREEKHREGQEVEAAWQNKREAENHVSARRKKKRAQTSGFASLLRGSNPRPTASLH